MRSTQPNFFLPFDRCGIDPFTQLFPITLRLEGTVRGSGGINIVDEHCATRIPGLYAVGDAATRELVSGGASRGGSINASWAMASGCWAGSAATEYARRSGRRLKSDGALRRYEHTAGHSTASNHPLGRADLEGIVRAVQGEVFPYDRNFFRSGRRLQDSLHHLDQLWADIQHSTVDRTDSILQLRARETSAMIATARWMYTSALMRQESRALHRREDYPSPRVEFQHRLLTGGLQEIWTEPYHAKQFNQQEVLR